jgi:hypothetical protein
MHFHCKNHKISLSSRKSHGNTCYFQTSSPHILPVLSFILWILDSGAGENRGSYHFIVTHGPRASPPLFLAFFAFSFLLLLSALLAVAADAAGVFITNN